MMDLKDLLEKHRTDFAKVVPFQPGADKLLAMDFTNNNTGLTMAILNDTGLFCRYIDQQLLRTGATYGIGGYNENRAVYARSNVFDGAGEPRRLHLGVDIWGKDGTPVYAPLDGRIHSFAFNDRYGDYGATIILQHELEGGIFHTLYGHLSLACINGLEKNTSIPKGTQIATFGTPEENGHWPPHLHFQVIIDMEKKEGDYPGVCALSQRGKYLANCPDPDPILDMVRFAIP